MRKIASIYYTIWMITHQKSSAFSNSVLELSFGFKKLDVQVIDGGEYFKDIDFITLLILNNTSNSVVKILPKNINT